ncbi:LRR receptor-like serine/threonine-protein kinase EFR [Camellia sinensis]|uniref:LRR receptor-like serine/threonine-protein kinase EFR n=1 Tax=Camellia sinensis TaxID=4442 RepID=UPI001036E3B4|nr:LRR receptor-like serine/threonine-protein kinase EFR [Camellia sinensis]
MSLTGSLSPHLGNLSFLSLLDISFNDFHGQIPEELSRLHLLKQVNFDYNNFTGDLNSYSWFGNLPELQYLLLYNNSFTGTIGSSLCNISNLEGLDLGQNYLQGNIPDEIGKLSNLKFLNLESNQITGSIPSAMFFNMSSLQTIALTYNNLYDSLPVYVCDHLPNLQLFYVSANRFYGEIPSSLYKCRELQHLSLSFNSFNGSIPREIGNLTMLKELYIGYNDFKGELPSEMGNLVNLEVLNAKSGSLTGPIPSFIVNMSSLRVIDFTNNSLSGSLPLDIQYDLPFLEELQLNSNKLSGQFPPGLWECKWLQILSLAINDFTGSISNNIGNLTLLRELHLGFNKLTGSLPEEIGNLHLERLTIAFTGLTSLIPSQIFNISTARIINLNGNQLSGHLPSSLGLWLPNLKELYLAENKLSGTIPSSISNASKLTILEMTTNSFTGSIPNTLGNLRFLRRFSVSENNLTRESSSLELNFITSLANCNNLEHLGIAMNQFNGILPASFGNLSTSLQSLEAFGCKLKGEIPIGIGNLSGLNIISLDNNEFTGFIPATIGRLEHLERLNLEHNRLQGTIPNDFCMSKNLGDLYLSDNKLNGSIPACLGEQKTLRHVYLESNNLNSTIPLTLWSLRDLLGLNLSSNSLTGYIPLDIGNLRVITEIDLSWNQLSGDIPSTIGGAQALVTLSLAHNKLQGPIPQSLGKLINLEFLDLSHNNLSRDIPQSLEALKYLQYLNLSFNNLQGEIPTGGHFANFTAESFMQNSGLCGAPRLQVPPCKTIHKSRKSLDLLKYILPSIAFAILVAAFVWIRCRKVNMALPIQVDSMIHSWRRFSYQELVRATNAFSESNLLGTGSFGSVYKGILLDGMSVAIKVFNLQTEGSFKSFDTECEVMCNIRHRNLLKIISSCSITNFKALIFEYMPNGSLQKWLYSHNNFLDVLQRLNIMIDVALAMEHLHHGLTTPIVHCDLKPDNVLLDEDMVAHVGDFGIAKLFGEGEYIAQTKTLATIGYMAPEYGMEGIVSAKGDVYSYGIMLMEVFTRKKPTDEMFEGEMSLKSWVSDMILQGHGGSILLAMDSNLIGSESEDVNFTVKEQCVLSVLSLAMDCLKDQPNERINMKDASARLRKIRTVFLANNGKGLKGKDICQD